MNTDTRTILSTHVFGFEERPIVIVFKTVRFSSLSFCTGVPVFPRLCLSDCNVNVNMSMKQKKKHLF